MTENEQIVADVIRSIAEMIGEYADWDADWGFLSQTDHDTGEGIIDLDVRRYDGEGEITETNKKVLISAKVIDDIRYCLIMPTDADRGCSPDIFGPYSDKERAIADGLRIADMLADEITEDGGWFVDDNGGQLFSVNQMR